MNDKLLVSVVVRVPLQPLCRDNNVYHHWVILTVRQGKELQMAPFNKSLLLHSIRSGWEEFTDAGCTVDEEIDD